MPATARMAFRTSRRDSWPPTTMRLHRSIEAEDTAMDIDSNQDELSLEDDDPINYFLTPTPLLDDGDTDDDTDSMDLEMEMFDAGIEDPHHPQPTIRSISPSDLTGPSRPPTSLPKMLPLPIRSPTPPKARSNSLSPPSRNSPEALTPNTEHDDDDDEDYVRFTPHGTLAPFNLHHNFGSSKSKGASRKAAAAAKSRAQRALDKNDRVGMMMAHGPTTSTDNLLLPPGAFHVGRPPTAPTTRGRSLTSPGRRPRLVQRPRSWSGPSHAGHFGGGGENRLSPRAWREPSPDVWSIEEEPEAEMLSEFGEGSVEVDTLGQTTELSPGGDKAKKVRFALAVTDIP
ncbi:hypothetical protein N8I77_009255 [Diaporthe amygdali]|uniref:Uncharacterized protein n=1 Tax=Phomopsis amygdali TaxID=1214568 RepID=A0AAD9W0I6_PHOAM|nr:hypothetical protein N8I77_009255 [Diaporthe amygdali]